MKLSTLTACALSLATAFFVTHSVAADVAPTPSIKWRVDFNGKAATEGEIQFRLTPHEGEPLLVTTKIRQSRAEIYIAQDVRDSFKNQLPKQRFRSEIVAGERLIVKAHSGEQAFLLELVASSVSGTHIHISPG